MGQALIRRAVRCRVSPVNATPTSISAALALAAVLFLSPVLSPAPALAQCIEGNCVNGIGTKITRGHKYEGEFKNNHREGYGRYIFPDGSVYMGEFHLGDMEGQGVYTFPNGDVYKGMFKDNMRNGQGTYTTKKGDSVSGLWKDNVLVMEGQGLSTEGLQLDEENLPEGQSGAGNGSEQAAKEGEAESWDNQ